MPVFDATACIVLICIVGAVVSGIVLGRGALNSANPDNALKLAIALPSVFFIVSLKLYDKINTEAVTFVIGTLVGYVFSGKPVTTRMEKLTQSASSDKA